ncbi:hypothetical protein MN116_002450 [Schistosoma mekongi]|uniref:Uncharacterized protein n=1 Tax=Schistosoma mekongi TaxID=38744 RepID=A0AAE2D9R4_SCHME|nr:hypothetical protein MN116_002450 [Schistosoma mekongi]
MFRNLCNTYCLLIISFSIATYTCSLPFISRNHMNSNHLYSDDNANNDYTSNDIDNNLLVPVTLPFMTTSTDTVPSSLSTIKPISSLLLSKVNDEEALRLQLALSLQIDSEVNKAINLEAAAHESIQQANLMHKAAEEAKYHAKIAEQMLNSMKYLQNTNDKYLKDADDDVDNEHNNNNNNEYKKRMYVKVPKINHDYLLDKEIGNQIDNDENSDRLLHEHHHRHHHHHHHQQQQQHHNHNKQQKKRKVSQLLPKLQLKHSSDYINNEYNNHNNHNKDNSNVDNESVLNNSRKTNKEQLNAIEQLTLEKLRLLILRELIKNQKQHQDDIEFIPYRNDNNQQYIKMIPSKFIDYSLNSNNDIQYWRQDDDHVDDDDDDDDDNDNNNDDYHHHDDDGDVDNDTDANNENNQKDLYGIDYHLLKHAYLNTIDNEDSIVFK